MDYGKKDFSRLCPIVIQIESCFLNFHADMFCSKKTVVSILQLHFLVKKIAAGGSLMKGSAADYRDPYCKSILHPTLKRAIDHIDQPVILAGYSYCGFIITNAAAYTNML